MSNMGDILTISLLPGMREKLEKKASKAGLPNINQYIVKILEKDLKK